MSVANPNVTGFRGTLVREEHLPGKHLIKLVFRTEQGMRFSLTRDFNLARRLRVGRPYRISGPTMTVGDIACVVNPAVRLAGWRRVVRPYVGTLTILLIAVVTGGVYGYFQVASDNPNAHQVHAQSNEAAEQTPVSDTAAPEAPVDSTPAAQPAPAPAATPQAPSTTRRSSSSSKPVTSSASPTSASIPPQPVSVVTPSSNDSGSSTGGTGTGTGTSTTDGVGGVVDSGAATTGQ